MAGSKTNFLENELLDHVLKNLAYTPTVTVSIMLLTADPTDAGTQTNEVTNANAYARQSMAFDVASGGVTQNTALVSFPQATGSWGTVTHFGLVDSATHGLGNMLMHGDFTTGKAIATDDTAEVQAGDLTVTES